MIADTTTIEAPAETALTRDERIQLGQLEAVIERGLKTFYEVGAALADIREQRLYRTTHSTFAGYCQERWNFSTAHANRLIGAALVVENLTPIGVKPANESQARPLTGLKPEQQREVWEQAVSIANGQPTAAQVSQAAYQYPNSQSPRQPWELQNDMIAWLVLQPAPSRLEIALGWQRDRNDALYWQEMVATLPTPWRSSDLTKAVDGTVAFLQKHDGELIRAEAAAPPRQAGAVAAPIHQLEQHVRAWLAAPDIDMLGHRDPLDHLVDIKEKKHGWGVAWNNLKWGLDNDGVVYRASDLHQAVNNVLDQYRVRNGEQEQTVKPAPTAATPITVPTASFRDAIHAALHVGPKADAVIHHVFFHNSRPHIAVAVVYHPGGREEFECYELVDLPMYPYPGAVEGLYSGLPVSYVGHSYRLGNPVRFCYEPAEGEDVDPWELLREKLAAIDGDDRADLANLLASTASGLSEPYPAAAEFVAAVVALLMAEEVAA